MGTRGLGRLKGLALGSVARKEKAQVATISAHNDPTIGSWWPTPWKRWATRASSPSRSRRPPRPCSSLRRALEAPTRRIAENCAVDGGVVVARTREGKNTLGFDGARKEYVDLVEAGIIDPTKVLRIALENAVSVAAAAGGPVGATNEIAVSAAP
ncbi:MAG: hypothetical protein GWN84_17675 [Gammaproteobacteria bacterium]|nr:hypothetical protein [Gammaproteobacteria bacterium]NIR88933.1 hypothetical protein [Gammaproteobacteria bacterium]NIU05222.1 hypothetical protein [Gammaproteobacteria bacterium]NIV52837.1 hypothetical protein [Gammaproteobacteria bacterium]NIW85133.1 hypothetical protein [Gammaproteobacteria bacterium]